MERGLAQVAFLETKVTKVGIHSKTGASVGKKDILVCFNDNLLGSVSDP